MVVPTLLVYVREEVDEAGNVVLLLAAAAMAREDSAVGGTTPRGVSAEASEGRVAS